MRRRNCKRKFGVKRLRMGKLGLVAVAKMMRRRMRLKKRERNRRGQFEERELREEVRERVNRMGKRKGMGLLLLRWIPLWRKRTRVVRVNRMHLWLKR